MGDVLTLIDKVQSQMDEDKAKELERKIKKAEFDFDDYLDQMQQMKNMGGMQKLMEMMPGGMGGLGGGKANLKDVDWNEGDKAIKQMEAIIQSMTKQERRNPDLLSPPRKKRIAMGAGVDISEVNRVVKQFGETRKMMKQFSGMMGGKSKKRFKLPFGL
jgi:signal recognition particle subunit SRP54